MVCLKGALACLSDLMAVILRNRAGAAGEGWGGGMATSPTDCSCPLLF